MQTVHVPGIEGLKLLQIQSLHGRSSYMLCGGTGGASNPTASSFFRWSSLGK